MRKGALINKNGSRKTTEKIHETESWLFKKE